MSYHNHNPMSKEPSSVNSSHPGFFKVDKAMAGGNLADAGKAKGVEIGEAPHNPVNGGDSQPVKIADDYAKHVKSEWLKAKGYKRI